MRQRKQMKLYAGFDLFDTAINYNSKNFMYYRLGSAVYLFSLNRETIITLMQLK